MIDSKYVQIHSAEGKLAAEMVRLLLESFGINAILEQESVGNTYGLVLGSLGEVVILVPENQAQDAIQILASMDRGELEINDDEVDGDEESNKDNTKPEG
jgi:hypothetical protein